MVLVGPKRRFCFLAALFLFFLIVDMVYVESGLGEGSVIRMAKKFILVSQIDYIVDKYFLVLDLFSFIFSELLSITY